MMYRTAKSSILIFGAALLSMTPSVSQARDTGGSFGEGGGPRRRGPRPPRVPFMASRRSLRKAHGSFEQLHLSRALAAFRSDIYLGIYRKSIQTESDDADRAEASWQRWFQARANAAVELAMREMAQPQEQFLSSALSLREARFAESHAAEHVAEFISQRAHGLSELRRALATLNVYDVGDTAPNLVAAALRRVGTRLQEDASPSWELPVFHDAPERDPVTNPFVQHMNLSVHHPGAISLILDVATDHVGLWHEGLAIHRAAQDIDRYFEQILQPGRQGNGTREHASDLLSLVYAADGIANWIHELPAEALHHEQLRGSLYTLARRLIDPQFREYMLAGLLAGGGEIAGDVFGVNAHASERIERKVAEFALNERYFDQAASSSFP